MDGLLNKAKSAMSSSNDSQGTTQQGGDANTQQTGTAGSSSGEQDYGDKGLAFLEKKTGHTFTNEQNEKITDGARDFYEKQTGSKVDSKYSN